MIANLQMNEYVGTKRVNGAEMSRGDYNKYRGWEIPADENPDDEGYLVEYLDGGKPNHPYFKGYISWSPKDVFEQSYFRANSLNFGIAFEQLRKGYKIARKSWYYEKYLVLKKDNYSFDREELKVFSDAKKQIIIDGKTEDVIEHLPSICLKTGNNKVLTGWLPQIDDLLATDWYILESK